MADNLRDRLQPENFQSTPREPSKMSDDEIKGEIIELTRKALGYKMVFDKLKLIGGETDNLKPAVQEIKERLEALKNELNCRQGKGDIEGTEPTEESVIEH